MSAEGTIITTNRVRAKWRLSSALLFIALAVEVYFLVRDVPIFTEPGMVSPVTGTPIAELMSHRNSVRVQPADDLVWDDVQDHQALYRRQSLLTSERSSAEIAFSDGTGLVVDENSLIQLESHPPTAPGGAARMIVRLLHGSLKRRGVPKAAGTQATPAALEIQIGQTLATVSPQTELTVSVDAKDPESSQIIVQSGEAKIESPKQEPIELKTGEEAAIQSANSEAPRIVTQIDPFTLVTPDLSASFRQTSESAEVRVPFQWKVPSPSAAEGPMELEASTDPNFATGIVHKRIAATEPPLRSIETALRIPVSDRDTLWYWRVRSVNQTHVASPVERFWVKASPKPRLWAPAQGFGAAQNQPVDFSWAPVAGASGYEIDGIGGAPARTATSAYRAEALAERTTHWRVRALFENGEAGPWSEARAITVRAPAAAADSAPPPPDELQEPEFKPAAPSAPAQAPAPSHTWLEKLYDLLVVNANAEIVAEEPDAWIISLKWNAVPGVKKYRVQIGRERTFKHVLVEVQSNAPEWAWTYHLGDENTKGRVFYRVASVSDSGKPGRFSKPKPIQIPQTILARKGGKTTYSSIDGPEGVPTDAAPKGNLETVLIQPHYAKKLLPEPVASPAPHTKAPVTTTAPATSPGKSVASAETIDAHPLRIDWDFGVFTGIGNLSQSSSAPNLSSVSMVSPYIQQKFALGFEFYRSQEESPTVSHWRAEIAATLAGFKKNAVDSSGLPDQPDLKAATFSLEILHWAESAGISASDRWNWSWGGVLERSYRFVKTGVQAVDAEGALSLGPTARAVRNYSEGTGISPTQLGFGIQLPLTGMVTGGALSLEGNLWAEWKLVKFASVDWIGARLEGDASYSRWSSPDGTSLTAWAIWLAPTFHFGSGEASDITAPSLR